MKTALDCIPCFLRTSLEAARMVSNDPAIHEQIIRDILHWAGEMDLDQSPPVMAQRVHRQLRQLIGMDDPYRQAKEQLNHIAMAMIPALRSEVRSASDPLLMAARLAIAGNVIDMSVKFDLTEADLIHAVDQAYNGPFYAEIDEFRQSVESAQSILYLADNAGEIAFDRLLIEQLSLQRVTLTVRGAPVINDATMEDARLVGLDKLVDVIDNGSDAPGTILNDCSHEFQDRFNNADLIIAKGQGNFESLSQEPGNIFFLFKVKCPLIAEHVKQPVGTQMILRSRFA